MLTLRRHSIKLTEKERENLFIHFTLDTEASGYGSSLDRYFNGDVIIQKPWIGKISKDKSAFSVRRTKTGLFKTGVSIFEITGRLRINSNESDIEIMIRPVWYTILSLIWTVTFLCFLTGYFFNNVFGWTTLTFLLAIQIFFIVQDLNITNERLIDYVDQCRK